MKGVVLTLALVLLASAVVAQTGETIVIEPNTVKRVVVPKGVTFQQLAWSVPEAVEARVHVVACFGDNVQFYAERREIDPDTDKVRATLRGTMPSYTYVLPRASKMYVGLKVTTGTTEEHQKMNGAFDVFIGTEAGLNATLPAISSTAPTVSISSNSETATLTWEWNDDDVGTIYRRDVARAGLNVSAWMPPPSFFLTGCSAEYWMEVDHEATDGISRSRPSSTWMGTVRMSRIVEDKVTFVAITTRHNTQNTFSTTFPIIALNSAPAAAPLSLLFLVALVLAVSLLF